MLAARIAPTTTTALIILVMFVPDRVTKAASARLGQVTPKIAQEGPEFAKFPVLWRKRHKRPNEAAHTFVA